MSEHNPIYHLKDSYFFEVPKAMWRQGWKTLDDVPQFLRDGSPEVTDVAAFNAAMDGKILIPQPFATLDSLYAVKSGFGISKYMILEVVLAGILIVLFSRLARTLQSGAAPRGWFANLFEAMILFVRDKIARPAIDSHDHGHHAHEAHGRESADHHDARTVPAAAAAVHEARERRIRTGELGFEPRLTGSEPVVLPLHHSPMAGFVLV